MYDYLHRTPATIEVDLERLGLLLEKKKLSDYSPTSNSGAKFKNEVFSISSYCWCDGDEVGHEKECPPNFLHRKSGFAVSWYKCLGRSTKQNKVLSDDQWTAIYQECLGSIQ